MINVIKSSIYIVKFQLKKYVKVKPPKKKVKKPKPLSKKEKQEKKAKKLIKELMPAALKAEREIEKKYKKG